MRGLFIQATRGVFPSMNSSATMELACLLFSGVTNLMTVTIYRMNKGVVSKIVIITVYLYFSCIRWRTLLSVGKN